MVKINENYLKLKSSYLFSEIAKRVAAFQGENPGKEIIKMGIGDVTRALPGACIRAFHAAVDEMSADSTFRGYGPEQGYGFLREKIADSDFRSRGADISPDEIFVSDGAKSDTGNFQEIFSGDVRIAIPDPVYPVYIDTNVMAGRAGDSRDGRYDGIAYLDCTESNGFVPDPPAEKLDLIYLCYPNNPTGATATKEKLAEWVEYAKRNKSVILFDAAYEAFIRDDSIPHSIYEIDGARDVAVEFRSFSKTAGFTGTRCAYTVVPKSCNGYDSSGNQQSLHPLWFRRCSTKFNGVSYPVQRAAEAVFSDEGAVQTRKIIDEYLGNAKIVRETFSSLGYKCTGGDNSPYIWIDTRTNSWNFFDMLLAKAGVVCTPGEGFGNCGRGYIRISAFNTRKNVERAMEKIRALLNSGTK